MLTAGPNDVTGASFYGKISYLIVALTSRCNLHCAGCIQNASAKGNDMDDRVMDTLLARMDNGKPLLVQLTGGEPTLLPEKIERFARAVQQFRRKPRLALQTNGTLITPHLVAILRKYEIETGLSIDGPPELQEELRGGSTAALKGLRLLEAKRIPFRVTTVVSAASVGQLDKLALFLAAFSGCRGMGLDLLVKKGRGTTRALSSPESLTENVRRLVSTLRFINSRRKIPLQLRELSLLERGRGAAFCHAASGRSLAVTPTGRLYPCGQVMNEESFSLGSIEDPRPRHHLLQSVRLQCPEGVECELQGRCPGDCPSRLLTNGDDGQLICALYRGIQESC
ncbi:radical SAM protein [Desulforhopalus vacuolatus]|uniref:radical SAM/SPASM domain-containing protein n=1 Tax=Desulforhopalus vacuolatus TaxID=40414 RepID=UPI0019656FF7|nr:radical SAM protein [Desulforhopalus vacuolatus]MBM9520792.1 radical SAM protein [Desulforhopalus vacuolatus]